MVALKLLSKEDVIAAYLKSFGFTGERLRSVVQLFADDLKSFASDDGEDLMLHVDCILLKIARRVFSKVSLDDEQLLAQFKLCFLLADGARFCSVNRLHKLVLPQTLIQKMREYFVRNAPSCHYTEMPPQSLENMPSLQGVRHA